MATPKTQIENATDKTSAATQQSRKNENQTGTGISNGSSTGKNSTLNDLFEDGLKDILSAERQLLQALPEMANAADNEELEDAFNQHLEHTRKQVQRIEKIFNRMGIDIEEKKCAAMEGLIEEGRKIISEFEMGPVRDSALIIGAQKIEHYEIASYGSLCELADVLNYQKAKDILGRTLEEEEETDELLSEIAMDINDEAYEISLEDENYQ